MLWQPLLQTVHSREKNNKADGDCRKLEMTDTERHLDMFEHIGFCLRCPVSVAHGHAAGTVGARDMRCFKTQDGHDE